MILFYLTVTAFNEEGQKLSYSWYTDSDTVFMDKVISIFKRQYCGDSRLLEGSITYKLEEAYLSEIIYAANANEQLKEVK